jgi:hypothetical protein
MNSVFSRWLVVEVCMCKGGVVTSEDMKWRALEMLWLCRAIWVPGLAIGTMKVQCESTGGCTVGKEVVSAA